MSNHEPKCPRGGQLGKQVSTKTKTLRQEQAIADTLGGHRQPASGAVDGHKGDVRLDRFLLDSKQTVHDMLGVTRKDLTKITQEAYGEGKEPGLVLTWENLKTVEQTWALVPLSVFKQMLDEAQ